MKKIEIINEKTYVEFCWEFDALNPKVTPTHGKRGRGSILTTITRIALAWINTTSVKQ
jgi:hypothetical protein